MLQKQLWSVSSSTYLSLSSALLFGSAGAPPAMEEGEPDGGIASHLGNHFVGNGGGFRAPRQHRQFVIEPGKSEFNHHAVQALLHQKFVEDWRSVVAGKSVSVRVNIGCHRPHK